MKIQFGLLVRGRPVRRRKAATRREMQVRRKKRKIKMRKTKVLMRRVLRKKPEESDK